MDIEINVSFNVTNEVNKKYKFTGEYRKASFKEHYYDGGAIVFCEVARTSHEFPIVVLRIPPWTWPATFAPRAAGIAWSQIGKILLFESTPEVRTNLEGGEYWHSKGGCIDLPQWVYDEMDIGLPNKDDWKQSYVSNPSRRR